MEQKLNKESPPQRGEDKTKPPPCMVRGCDNPCAWRKINDKGVGYFCHWCERCADHLFCKNDYCEKGDPENCTKGKVQ